MTNKTPVDPTYDTILDYCRSLCAMWMLKHTLTKGQLKRYKFEYESHKNVIAFIKKYEKFLEPIARRKMRVGVITTASAVDRMRNANETVAWDGTRLDVLCVGVEGVLSFMKMYSIPCIANQEEFEKEAELSIADDVHLTRLIHKEFPMLPYGFDETKPWPTTCGRPVDPSTIPPLKIYE